MTRLTAGPVPSGRLALQAARNHHPELILLNVNLPKMNGHRVCEQLKAEEKLKEIPAFYQRL